MYRIIGLNNKTDIIFHYVTNVIDTSNPVRAIGLLVKNNKTSFIEPMRYIVRTVGLLGQHIYKTLIKWQKCLLPIENIVRTSL